MWNIKLMFVVTLTCCVFMMFSDRRGLSSFEYIVPAWHQFRTSDVLMFNVEHKVNVCCDFNVLCIYDVLR